MSKHTPGPWRISGYYENTGYLEPVIAGMINDCTVYVAVCIECPGMDDANARLISAAPELLEALKLALNNFGEDDDEWTDMARSAIAKALGEE